MNSESLVSIIMPVYNSIKYLKQSIESILGQSYKNFEFLIADDDSTDGSRKILESLDDVRIQNFPNNQHLGYLKTWNKLISKAKGQYITFQDSDDYSHPDRLEKQLKVFNDFPKIKMCGTWSYIIKENGDKIRIDKRNTNPEVIKKNIGLKSQFSGSTIMIKREVYDRVGGYREYFDQMAYQDYDWSYRIIDNFQGYNIPEPLYYYRQHRLSNSKKIDIVRSISKDLVRYLGKQRETSKEDDLMKKDYHNLDKKRDELLAPYLKDKSRIYREYASTFMYSKMYNEAIKSSFLGLLKEPWKAINHLTFFYCLRKKIFKKHK